MSKKANTGSLKTGSNCYRSSMLSPILPIVPEPAVSVTDGSKYGTPYNVTKTLRYNANGGLQLQLPLYNQTLYTSIAISELVNRIDLLSYEKAKEDLIVEIGKLYFLGQTTICQLQIIEGNIARLDSLRNITQAFFVMEWLWT